MRHFVVAIGNEKPFRVSGTEFLALLLVARITVCVASLWATRVVSFFTESIAPRWDLSAVPLLVILITIGLAVKCITWSVGKRVFIDLNSFRTSHDLYGLRPTRKQLF